MVRTFSMTKLIHLILLFLLYIDISSKHFELVHYKCTFWIQE